MASLAGSRQVRVQRHDGGVVPGRDVALEYGGRDRRAELQRAALVELGADVGVDGDRPIGERNLENGPANDTDINSTTGVTWY